MSTQETMVRQVRQHSRQLVRELDVVRGVYLDTGYTLSQCHVLFEISLHSSLNLMQLAEALLIDKSNTSRTVKQLVELGLVNTAKLRTDNRQKLFSLTSKGKKALATTIRLANQQVENALATLNDEQQRTVVHGLRLYAEALRKGRLQSKYTIRPIQKQDNAQIARLIRTVMTEFAAVGAGYSIEDPELDDMYGGYRNKQSCYYVVAENDRVVGCGGIAALAGADKFTCELRKMFFLPAIRGLGLGRRLLSLLMEEARKRGYRQCYLETLDRMWRANQLYQQHGFRSLKQAMGQTGHDSCNRWYLLDLIPIQATLPAQED